MLLWTTTLFIFWLVLSGKFDYFHVSLGALCAAGVVYTTRRLGMLHPALIGLHARSWPRWPGFLLWLMREIVVSAVQVSYAVVQPRLPISPRIVRFKCSLPHSVAHLTLANSITLTPGTVTIDFKNEEYTVHALTQEAGEALTPPSGRGEMPKRISHLFARSGSAK